MTRQHSVRSMLTRLGSISRGGERKIFSKRKVKRCRLKDRLARTSEDVFLRELWRGRKEDGDDCAVDSAYFHNRACRARMRCKSVMACPPLRGLFHYKVSSVTRSLCSGLALPCVSLSCEAEP